MTDDQFLIVKDIIDDFNKNFSKKIQDVKDELEPILLDISQNICNYYSGLYNCKVSGCDDYLFDTSYENSSKIRYLMSFQLNNAEYQNLDMLVNKQKNHKKVSKKQFYMEQIAGVSLKPIPYIQDCCKKVSLELKNYGQFLNVFAENCIINFIYKDCFVEIVVCYELKPKELSYQKGCKVFQINLFDLYNNFYIKEKETNGMFSNMCKIYKALEKELIYAGISDIYLSNKSFLIENLLFNVPNNLFSNDLKLCFLKTCSYLINCDFDNFKSVYSSNMFDELNYKKKKAKNLVRKIMYSYNNFDYIIELSNENTDINYDNNTNQNLENDVPKKYDNLNDDYKNFKDKRNN